MQLSGILLNYRLYTKMEILS